MNVISTVNPIVMTSAAAVWDGCPFMTCLLQQWERRGRGFPGEAHWRAGAASGFFFGFFIAGLLRSSPRARSTKHPLPLTRCQHSRKKPILILLKGSSFVSGVSSRFEGGRNEKSHSSLSLLTLVRDGGRGARHAALRP